MLTTQHHSAKASDFRHKGLDFDFNKVRIQEFFGELGFDVKTRTWGKSSEHSITVVQRRREGSEATDFGFTELEKAIYVVCVILREQQGSPITEDLIIDHLARKKDEIHRLVIKNKDIEPTLTRLEERGILIKTGDREYDKGWNWDVFFEPNIILGLLEKSIEYDQKYRPQIQSKIPESNEENKTNETIKS
jgi:hypothetical protein